MRLLLTVSLLPLLFVACASEASKEPGSQTDAGGSSGATASSSSSAGSSGSTADAEAPADVPLAAFAFAGSEATLLNPERGTLVQIDLRSDSSFADVRAQGHALAYAPLDLEDFRVAAIDQATLEAFAAGFARVRSAGFKVVLRAAYNDGPIGAADAKLSRVLGHIEQLRPLLVANADVIAVVEAGFFGAWGEWHSSTNELGELSARTQILHALLAAVPSSRAVLVRTPKHVDDVFPGGPMADAIGFDGSDRARIGHHNDCFLASADDEGTYPEPVATWKAYVAADSRFTPMGGETCGVDAPRSECASALSELAQLHFTFLNQQYHPGVWDSWRVGGCESAVRNRLGYRFRLTAGSRSESVRPGGTLRVALSIHNDGFAALMNQRPLLFIVHDASNRYAASTAIDARRWSPGSDSTVSVALALPAAIAPGTYTLSLALPDADEGLRAREEFAIRFANTAPFRDGATELGDVVVSADAIEVPDPTATPLRAVAR